MSCLSKQYLSLGVILVLLLPWKIQPSCHVVIFEHANCDFVTNLPKSVTKSHFLPTSLSSHSKIYQSEMIILLILHFQRAIRVWQNNCKLLQDYQLASFRVVPISPFPNPTDLKAGMSCQTCTASTFQISPNISGHISKYLQTFQDISPSILCHISKCIQTFVTHFKMSSNFSWHIS